MRTAIASALFLLSAAAPASAQTPLIHNGEFYDMFDDSGIWAINMTWEPGVLFVFNFASGEWEPRFVPPFLPVPLWPGDNPGLVGLPENLPVYTISNVARMQFVGTTGTS